MRISLLLKREPFGPIVEKTLARFWRAQYGRAYEVRWREGCPGVKALKAAPGGPGVGEQLWLCNIYLNAFFTPEVNPELFDPIKREFARSVVRWRRPLQRAYVAMSVWRMGAPWMAQANLSVTPSVPDVENKILVAGNHKLRILDLKARAAYAISKGEFGNGFLRREVIARREAARLRLPVPELKSVADDGSWFSESYVSGTPLNRLADPESAGRAASRAARDLFRLLEETAGEEHVSDYCERLRERIMSHVEGSHLLSEFDRRQIGRSVKSLAREVDRLRAVAGNRVVTALAHGDFQPANILSNEDGVWLIDWEYSGRRQSGYDALVFALGSRFPEGLSERLERFVARGLPESYSIDRLPWPGAGWRDAEGRRLRGALFLLEELLMHLEENADPCFSRTGEGLAALRREIDRWASAGRPGE
ncbi:MAG TPA: phosphotransferase [Blastocatellia bacterium]|nr:phosphotransferase [Blastocatellia bacterium]